MKNKKSKIKNKKFKAAIFICAFCPLLLLIGFFAYAQDATPPQIAPANIRVVDIGETFVTVTWITDEPSTSQVEYGITESFGSLNAPSLSLVTSHSSVLTGLERETRYYFRVRSKDAAGNEAISSGLTTLSFVTKAKGVVYTETAPLFLTVQIVNITKDSMRVTWRSNTDNIYQVEYGPKEPFDKQTGWSSEYKSWDVAELFELFPGTLYYAKIKIKDRSGKEAFYRLSFTTTEEPVAGPTPVAEEREKPISAMTLEEKQAKILELQATIAQLQKMIAALLVIKGQSPSLPEQKASEEFSYTFTRPLYWGLRNNFEVKMLQEALSRLGYFKASKTGNFFDLTYFAVQKFQKAYGIWAIGRVGPQTRAKLNELFSK